MGGETKIIPPLDTAAGLASDHKCVYVKNEFPKTRNFTWMAKFKRTRTRASEEAFAADLNEWDWSNLRNAATVDQLAKELEKGIATLTECHFPLVRVSRRSNEDPWISRSIRRLWKKKICIYKKFGKSQSWWETDQRLQTEIASAEEFFVAKMLEEGNRGRPFYAATRKLAAASPSQPWNVTDLFVGMGPAEVGQEVLDFFGGLARSDSEPMPYRARMALASSLSTEPVHFLVDLRKQTPEWRGIHFHTLSVVSPTPSCRPWRKSTIGSMNPGNGRRGGKPST